MLPLAEKGKNKFVLHLSRALYKEAVIEKAIREDQDWVRMLPSSEKKYFAVELRTPDKKDVLEWSNYLFYLCKAA